MDTLNPRAPGVVSRGLLDRIHAYLLASDVTSGGTGASLAAELERELDRK